MTACHLGVITMTGEDLSQPPPSYRYPPPPWAHPPPSSTAWVLAEIKQGVEVARHKLTHACTTLGRQESCDIPSLHASLSRVHARIAFDRSGTPWLRDLKSAHGVGTVKHVLLAEFTCALATYPCPNSTMIR